jgi:hypothetical protein
MPVLTLAFTAESSKMAGDVRQLRDGASGANIGGGSRPILGTYLT